MFAKFREFISSIDQKKRDNLLLVGLLIGALGLTVVVSQQPTRSRQQAAQNGSIKIINPVTGAEFPENRVYNPDAVYLKITIPDNWSLASSTNQNLLKKAYAQAPECRQERTICGQPAYGDCDFYCDNGKAFYDCVQTNNSACKGTIYAACENSKCPQPIKQPTPIPTSSTAVCSPGNVFDSVLCRRCAPDGSRWGEAGSDFGPSKGSKTWCSCAQRYQPNLYQAECAASQTPTPTPTSTPTGQPATTGGKKLKSITIRNTDSGSGGKPEFTFGPQDEWYGQAISGKLLWGLNKNSGPKTVSVTFTAEDGTTTTTQSTPVLLFDYKNLKPYSKFTSPSKDTVDLSTHPEGLTFTWDTVPGITRYLLTINSYADPNSYLTPVDNNCPPVPFLDDTIDATVRQSLNNWFICREGTNTSYTVARDKFENGKKYQTFLFSLDNQGNSNYDLFAFTVQGVPAGGSTNTPTPTVTPGGPTPTPIPGETTSISLAVKLRGIGPKGPDGTPEARNNPNPVQKKRNLAIYFYEPGVDVTGDVSGAKAKFFAVVENALVYNGVDTFYAERIVIDSKVAAGNYQILVRSPRYLRKQILGPNGEKTHPISVGKSNILVQRKTVLDPGDVNIDDIIDIEDYKIYLSCFGKQNADCVRRVDFNDDGKVDKKEPPPPVYDDYTLFLQQFKPPQ